ncbi:hypothetical protein WA026_006931 [Henosepilachna vigintioctopunctata]|uniref:Uncharacterized protein n=1 Tax=Henosepilachna vigintioctopunctata TaxID=420089 RepID=A0AAW1V812_9CUCU
MVDDRTLVLVHPECDRYRDASDQENSVEATNSFILNGTLIQNSPNDTIARRKWRSISRFCILIANPRLLLRDEVLDLFDVLMNGPKGDPNEWSLFRFGLHFNLARTWKNSSKMSRRLGITFCSGWGMETVFSDSISTIL